MKLLFLILSLSSSLYFICGTSINHHHHHHNRNHHIHHYNSSIALPPHADSPSSSPTTPIIENSTIALAPSPYVDTTPASRNFTNLTSTPPTYSSTIAPIPSPYVSKNSTNFTSSATPPSYRTRISPIPSPSVSRNSTNFNSTPPTYSGRIAPAPSHYVSPVPIAKNSTNSSSTPPTYSRSSMAPAPSPNRNNIEVYNVRSFGAIGDGVADDTEAFKSAWDSACHSDSSILFVPRAYKFLIKSSIFVGPCQNGVLLQIEGTIMPPDGPDSWPANNSKRQWLVFYRVEGLTMQGGGLIDGKGQKWWDLPCKPHKWVNGTTKPGPCDSPVALRFFMSSNITVRGLRIQNSPQFHFRFDSCHNVTVDSILISSPALSPNTDGIHVENSNNVGIYNSVISNGDDCISIGAGTLNVDVRNVTCGPSHGISIGSLGKSNSRACVTNITVTNAIIKNSDNGLRIKTWQGGSGSVSSISFTNIKMENVRNPIIIDQYYCLSKPCENQTSNVFISDVRYTGVKGTYDIRSPPVHLSCSDSVPCTNITFSDIELYPSLGDVIADPYCWNAYGGSGTLTIPPLACLLEGLPRLITDYGSEKCY